MKSLFIVGLPKDIATRIYKAANTNDFTVSSINADLSEASRLRLLPHDHAAIHSLNTYIEQQPYSDAHILVLRYAPLPSAVIDTLSAIEELGAKVENLAAGKDGWPRFGTVVDQIFLDLLYKAFEIKYFPKKESSVTDYFEALANVNKQLIITSGSLATCNKVIPQRKKFMFDAADSLVDIIAKNGNVGDLDQHFQKWSVLHAQTGPINAKLTIFRAGKEIYNQEKSTHLKQGDGTSPQGAPRIYYHALYIDKISHIGLLYAGPHPTEDLKLDRKHHY